MVTSYQRLKLCHQLHAINEENFSELISSHPSKSKIFNQQIMFLVLYWTQSRDINHVKLYNKAEREFILILKPFAPPTAPPGTSSSSACPNAPCTVIVVVVIGFVPAVLILPQFRIVKRSWSFDFCFSPD